MFKLGDAVEVTLMNGEKLNGLIYKIRKNGCTIYKVFTVLGNYDAFEEHLRLLK